MIPKSFGVCVKSSDGRVLRQDSQCQALCGRQQGRVCSKGCMERGEFDEGLYLLTNVLTPGGLTDAVVVREGDRLTTLIHPKNQLIQARLKELGPYQLSPAQTKVMELFYKGRSRKEICKSLFISLPTLKTHINNVYKKIPIRLKRKILRSRTGLIAGA